MRGFSEPLPTADVDEFGIRLARVEDAELLAASCKKCFPTSCSWQAPLSTRRLWWERAVTSDHASAMVLTFNGAVTGGFLLIIDETSWKQDHLPYEITRARKALTVLCRPALLINRVMHTLEARRRKATFDFDWPEFDQSHGVHAWLELLFVSPAYHNRGLGRRLLACAETRAIQLSRRQVRLNVEVWNRSAIRFYRCQGYVLHTVTPSGLTLIKRLSAHP